ncbi:transcription initiation factor IIB [Natrialbaceae archaeon A-gly3]
MAGTECNSTCPECGSRLRQRGIETVCEECGFVATVHAIDHGPEWRSFEDDDVDRKRTGAPLTRSRHDRGLSTEIGYGSDLRVTGRKRRRLARMRREHNRAQISTKADRNKITGFTEIRRVVSQLSLPLDVREQACAMFESAQSEDLLRGRSIEGFAAATVYATCRTLTIARTVEEIVNVAKANENELKAAYDALNRELGVPTGPIDPSEYLARYTSKLDLDTVVEHRAREYVSRLQEESLIGGRNPSGVAAACLYVAASSDDATETITQADAAEVADVSPVTIRSTVVDLQEL